MELRHLKYFVAVAEEENVSRAALRLRVSQPALSRQVRDLEEEIGFPLLERSAKSVRLTEAGRVFLPEARAVIERAREAVNKARAAAAGTSGELNVGYAPSLTVELLPRAWRAFQAEFPRVRVALHDLSTEEMLERLRTGKLAVALLARPTRRMLRGLNFTELARYRLCVAVAPGHALARSRSVSLARMAREPLIGYSRKDYPEYHEQLEEMFAAVGAKPRIVEEHDSVTSLIAAVEAGRGYALGPSCLACLAGPRLKLLKLKPPPAPIVVGAAWPADAGEMAAKFVEAARAPVK